MNCEDILLLQHAFIDQELDSAHELRFAEHLASCPSCAKQILALQAARTEVQSHATRHEVPTALFNSISVLISPDHDTHSAPSQKWLPLKWGATGAGLALAACLACVMIVSPNSSDQRGQQLIASHIRSLQENHLTDVISTDQHTVKPWFNGRSDISPPVIDLVAAGFPLIGGRLDYVDHHTTAVIVYRFKTHIINLFVWPSDPTAARSPSPSVQQGYNLLNWQDGDLQFWAVSDVNRVKLEEFVKLYRSQGPNQAIK